LVTVVRGGRLIDGTGADPVDGCSVLIEGDLIKEIGKTKDLDIPRDAKIIDATGKTVLPGLIDCHLHLLGLRSDNYIPETIISPNGVKVLRAAKSAMALLDAGFTTVKDTGGINALYLKQAINEGTMRGPRILAAGYVLNQTFGHGDDFQYLPVEWADARTGGNKFFALMCDGEEECMKAARYALREGADFIKICTSGGVMSQKDPPDHVQFTKDEVRAIVNVAHNARTFVTTHCMSTEGMQMSIEAGVKTVDHACFPDQSVIELGLKNGTIFVATMSIQKKINDGGIEAGYPEWAVEKCRRMWDDVAKNMKWLYDSGVTMAAGTDFLDTPLGKMGTNALEMELLVKYCGFKPMDALKAMTLNGAKACGLEKQIGTLEAGKKADLLVFDGDPLKDIKSLQETQRIQLVLKAGAVEVDRR
jgi:imidazolonepropionase-like amidohydrolase